MSMKKMMSVLWAAFRRPAPIQAASDDEMDHQLVMERSRGNLMIQTGQYSTEQDLQREYDSFKELPVDGQ
jgi:hypothetical protein